MITLRAGHERGRADQGWLKSCFSFSFADYYDPMHMHFGTLRVINDDIVGAGKGFGMHPHRDMEIVTYMLSGALQHRDSMGNGSIIRAGEVQKMSAGTGIMHSEMNPDKNTEAKLLQIWIFPDTKNLTPAYEQVSVPAELKRGRLHLIAGANADEHTVSLHQDVKIYAGCFDGDEKHAQSLKANRRYYVHVAGGEIHVNGHDLKNGDALLISAETALTIASGKNAEILLFDLA
jgi:redox-sensitive bicupin YhaK (pirin superfamily)